MTIRHIHMQRYKLAFVLIFALLGVYTIISSFAATPSCDLNATTSNFSSQLNAAQPGQTLCLASGNYGTLYGVAKSSPGITITAAQGAAPVFGDIHFDTTASPAWLTLDNVTFDGSNANLISAPAHDITFKNSTFKGYTQINPGASGAASGFSNNVCGNCPQMNNQKIVFDNDLFNLASCQTGSCLNYEGRISFAEDTTASAGAGVQIKNSVFETGCGDGVFFGSSGKGVTVGPGNEFRNLAQGSCGPHVDPIQRDGTNTPGPVITGNYFHDNATGIADYDGHDDATITNNVITNTSADWLDVPSYATSVVEHNTIIGGNIGCGYSHDLTPCQATIRNNIADSVVMLDAGGQPIYNDYNMCKFSCAGTHSKQSTTPTFIGGATPSTYSGYALATNSEGKNAGSDAKDIGVIFSSNGQTANIWIDQNGGDCTYQASATDYTSADTHSCSSIQAAVAAVAAYEATQTTKTTSTIRMVAGNYGAQTITTSLTSATKATVIGDTSGGGVTVGSLAPQGTWLELQNLTASSVGWEDVGAGLPHDITLTNVSSTNPVFIDGGANIDWEGGTIGPYALPPKSAGGPNGCMNFQGMPNPLTNVRLNKLVVSGCTMTPARISVGDHTEVVRFNEGIDGLTISNSIFDNESINSATIFFGSTGYGQAEKNITLQNNYFGASGNIALDGNLTAATDGNKCTGYNFLFNTSTNSTWGSFDGCAYTNSVIRGNISKVSGSSCISGQTYDYNIWVNSGSVNCGPHDKTVSSGGFTADGYHLQSNSPAVDYAATSCPSTDIDGDSRPQGLACDAGADEYVSSGGVIAPTNTVLPAISGTFQVGNTVTTTTGSWSNSPTAYAYQWQRCNSGGTNCTNISGATNSSYTLVTADNGSTLRAIVTASNTAGSASANSTVSTLIAAASYNQADLNHDGSVNIVDLSILASDWRRTDKPASDINQDGFVNITDLSILASNWGH